jgi:hypothetical protein
MEISILEFHEFLNVFSSPAIKAEATWFAPFLLCNCAINADLIFSDDLDI